MNSTDLFSFLDEVPAELGVDQYVDGDEVHMDMDPLVPSRFEDLPKKRKTVLEERNTFNTHNGSVIRIDLESEPGPSTLKKPRLASPKPVVVDEFEREAKREVAASAGLTGGIEPGTRLELRHQARVEF